jgi:tartrate dehydratase alpha subunit/fumarate hydratase class I-like protein
MTKSNPTIPALLSRYVLRAGSVACVAGLVAFGVGTSGASAATTTPAQHITAEIAPQATPWVVWDSKIPEESACIIEGEALKAQGVATRYKCEQVGATWTLYIVLVAACDATPASVEPVQPASKAVPSAC